MAETVAETGAAMLEVSPWGDVVELILSFLFPFYENSARGDARALAAARVLALIYWRQQGRHFPRPYCAKTPYDLLVSRSPAQRAYAIARYYPPPIHETVARTASPPLTVREKLRTVAAGCGYVQLLKDAVGESDISWLFWVAVSEGHANVVDYLHSSHRPVLELGLDADAGSDGDVVTMYWEPLVCAAEGGHLPMVRSLIGFGAGRGRRGVLAMTEAFQAAAGHLAAMQHLVGRGVRPTAGDRDYARARGLLAVLEYLNGLALAAPAPAHPQM